MKSLSLLVSALMFVPISSAFAAYQQYPVRNRLVYIDYGQSSYNIQIQNYAFRVEILSDSEGLKSEDYRNGRPFVTASPDERYSVRLYNPLPVRVAVNLTVDGVNSITGKPSGISGGEKWMIDANSFITIRGWQVNGGEARRFFFTEKPKSYAKWRGKHLHRDLAANCGVIGAAFFWSQKELDQYYEDHPIYRYPRPLPTCPYCGARSGTSGAAAGGARESLSSADATAEMRPYMAAVPMAKAAEQAGTGMGERESHPTTLVDFEYDTGMYQLAQALVVYYDFAGPTPEPNPFPGASYAPEM